MMNLGLHFDWLETHQDKRYVQTWLCQNDRCFHVLAQNNIKMSPKLKIKNDDINKQQKTNSTTPIITTKQIPGEYSQVLLSTPKSSLNISIRIGI